MKTVLVKLTERSLKMKGKSETVKQLAVALDCPSTSVYLAIKELEALGFLYLKRGKSIIQYAKKTFEQDEADKNDLMNQLKASEIF